MAGKPKVRELSLATKPSSYWLQTERVAHERWARIAVENPRASALLHVMLANMGRNNAVIMSHAVLAVAAQCSVSTLKRSIAALKEGNWIQVLQIGPSGTVPAYVINDRVAWSGPRDGIRYSMFSATIVVSDAEQPDKTQLGAQPPLERIPTMQAGEHQLPAGPSESVSQQSFAGFDLPDLPSRRVDPEK